MKTYDVDQYNFTVLVAASDEGRRQKVVNTGDGNVFLSIDMKLEHGDPLVLPPKGERIIELQPGETLHGSCGADVTSTVEVEVAPPPEKGELA